MSLPLDGLGIRDKQMIAIPKIANGYGKIPLVIIINKQIAIIKISIKATDAAMGAENLKLIFINSLEFNQRNVFL